MTEIKVVGVTIAILMVGGAAPAIAEFASQTSEQYDSEYCTWEIAGPIVQGEPPNWECVPPGTAVPF
jgi:hypothetical protein